MKYNNEVPLPGWGEGGVDGIQRGRTKGSPISKGCLINLGQHGADKKGPTSPTPLFHALKFTQFSNSYFKTENSFHLFRDDKYPVLSTVWV
jgi:hypothetical protein